MRDWRDLPRGRPRPWRGGGYAAAMRHSGAGGRARLCNPWNMRKRESTKCVVFNGGNRQKSRRREKKKKKKKKRGGSFSVSKRLMAAQREREREREREKEDREAAQAAALGAHHGQQTSPTSHRQRNAPHTQPRPLTHRERDR